VSATRRPSVAGGSPSSRGRGRNVEPATAAKDASQLRTHVLPKWGTWPLQSIGRLDVQTWVKDMTHAGVGANTVNACYRLLSRDAVGCGARGVIGASPCREIDLPRVVKPPPRWLTRRSTTGSSWPSP
jgi:hypothetical protein